MRALACAVGLLAAGDTLTARAAETVLVYVTDNGADTIHVLDGVTRDVVGVIGSVRKPYGIAFSGDNARVYVSSQETGILFILDQPTGDPFLRIRLSGMPTDLAVARDGEEVVVGIASAPGGLDIVSAGLVGRLATIALGAPIDSVAATPDGNFAIAGSREGRFISLVDLKARKEVRRVAFDRGVRQVAVEARTERNTGRIFVQLDGFDGFAVVDFDSGRETGRVALTAGAATQPAGAAGGIGIAPDGKTLWVGNAATGVLHALTLPDLKPAGEIRLAAGASGAAGIGPEWLAFSPAGTMYVAEQGLDAVAVVDPAAMAALARVDVGPHPMRIKVMVLPYDLRKELEEDERNAPER